MRAINQNDPWAEVLQLLCSQLGITQLATTALKPYKIAAGTARNTKLSLVAAEGSGLGGHIQIEYSRLELSKLLNKYAGVNKVPRLNLFGNPGAQATLISVLDQLNARFDLHLTMVGEFPDLAAQSFTMPAKGAYVDVTLMPISGNSVPPFSLRLASSNPGVVRIYNSGAKISDATVLRSVNPLQRANGNLNWVLDNRLATSVAPSPELQLYNLDFSDIFGLGAPGGVLCDRTYKPIGSTTAFIFSETVLAACNAKLASVGLPLLKNTQPQVKSVASLANWNLYTAVGTTANLIGDTSNGYNSRACINGVAKPYYAAYYDMYGLLTPTKPKQLNSAAFSNVFRVMRPDLTDAQIQYCSDVPDAMINGLNYFWYFHYNILP